MLLFINISYSVFITYNSKLDSMLSIALVVQLKNSVASMHVSVVTFFKRFVGNFRTAASQVL